MAAAALPLLCRREHSRKNLCAPALKVPKKAGMRGRIPSRNPGCAGFGPVGGAAWAPAPYRAKGYLQFLEEFSVLFWFELWVLPEVRFWVVFLALEVVFLALRLSMVLFSFQIQAS